MKSPFTFILLVICSLLITNCSLLIAQTPQAINYQAITRDSTGKIMTEFPVKVRVSILKDAVNGQAIYVETHNLITNKIGVINIEIGNGTPITGTFPAIDWGKSKYFIQLELDPDGKGYKLSGISQLLSVPYALYAENANVPGVAGPTGPAGDINSSAPGSLGQTLRHDGKGWVANSRLYNNGSKIGINTSKPFYSFEIRDTITTKWDYVFQSYQPDFDTLPLHIYLRQGRDNNMGDFAYFGATGYRPSYMNSALMCTQNYGVIFGTGKDDGTGLTTEWMRINPFGRVGIGTDAPIGKLNVEHASLSAFDPQLVLSDKSATGAGRINFQNSGSSNFWEISGLPDVDGGLVDKPKIQFMYSTVGTLMTLSGSGRFGLGTGTKVPEAKMQIMHASSPTDPQLMLSESNQTGMARLSFKTGTGDKFWQLAGLTDQLNDANSYFQLKYGTTVVPMTVTNTGRLGLGTQMPAAWLHVNAAATANLPQLLLSEATGNPARLQFQNTVDNSKYWEINGTVGTMGAGSVFNILYSGANVPAVTVSSSNLVGIGTATPTAQLHVFSMGSPSTPQLILNEKSYTGARLQFKNTYSDRYWEAKGQPGMTDLNSFFGIGLNTTGDIITVSGAGNVGINNPVPEYPLDIAGKGRMRIRQGDNGTAGLFLYQLAPAYKPDVHDRFFMGMASDTTVGFYSELGTGWSMVLTGVRGNLGIGTVNPGRHVEVSGSGQQYVRVTSENNNYAGIELFRPNSNAYSWRMYNRNGDMFFTNTTSQFLNDEGNTILAMKYNGYVGIGTGAPAGLFHVKGSSDFIIKDNGYVGVGTTTPEGMFHVNGQFIANCMRLKGGCDIAEPFDANANDNIQPGMLLAIDSENPGNMKISTQAYDTKVAGIVSGANEVNPGLIMNQEGKFANSKNVIALTGKVYCYADASNSPIKPGDLLTSSDIPGYAMKATDFNRSQGAIIGKAMSSLSSGKGFVLVLVSLQ